LDEIGAVNRMFLADFHEAEQIRRTRVFCRVQ
jgi:hypothetical protein